MTVAKRWSLGWALCLALGAASGWAQALFTPHALAFDVLELGRLALWPIGAVGLAATLGALLLGRWRGAEASRPVAQANLVWVRVLLALGAAFAGGEAFLRVVFHGGTTFAENAGPIVRRFNRHYTLNRFQSRGPDAVGPKPPGRVRLLLQGDSITFGSGVRDEQDLYSTQLLASLERLAPGRFEMAVVAKPGREIDGHLEQLRALGRSVAPDLIVYQWFLNDMELDPSLRPGAPGRFWRALPAHPVLYERSFAWFFLDNRLTGLLYGMRQASHEAYLLGTFGQDTPAWRRFAALFQDWAAEATALCPRVTVLLYPEPSGPMGEAYPFRELHARVMRLAEPLGVTTVDFVRTLDDLRDPRELRGTYASPFDDHPNAAMHRRVAERLEAHLRATWPEVVAGPVPAD